MSYNTDSPLLTRSTYLSDHGLCAAVPVYKRPVFRQSSPKLDLILNINVLESSPSASPFPHLLHKPLRVVSSNTRDFYSFKVLATSSLLVQVILSRPIEALTCTVPSHHFINEVLLDLHAWTHRITNETDDESSEDTLEGNTDSVDPRIDDVWNGEDIDTECYARTLRIVNTCLEYLQVSI